MRFWTRTALLTLLLYLLGALDVSGFGFAVRAPGWSLLAAAVTAGALGWGVVRSHWRGWRLAAALFLLHFGVAVVLTAVEAVYLEELRDVLVPLLVNGFVTAALFAPAAVLLHGRFGDSRDQAVRIRWRSLGWALPLLAVVWMILFVLGGVGVFLPLARQLAPGLLAGYTDLPAWVLPFQGLRAISWVLLALPMLAASGGNRAARGLLLGTLFAALTGSNLLLPNPLLPVSLQLAHLAEVTLTGFAFGYLTGWLLSRNRGWSERGERPVEHRTDDHRRRLAGRRESGSAPLRRTHL